MRKKSHILLARYLADQMKTADGLQSHRKAFCLGNILPDIRPSFLTKKHEFSGTFDEIKEKITTLVEQDGSALNERVYWRNFGEVMHYMADYFTFPHNSTYTGTLLEHGKYEKELKRSLKTQIRNGSAGKHLGTVIRFESLDELLRYIRQVHDRYLAKVRCIKEDIAYILSVCYQVIQGIFQLFVKRQAAV